VSPRCFGFAYNREDATCRRCAWKKACVPAWREWSQRKSLAEQLAAQESALATPTLDQAAIERIYDELYARHFGKRSRRRTSTRNNTTFGRLLSYCLREEVDPATFITANMVGLKRGGLPPCGFQPNMLAGEKAKGRYNAFVRSSRRRYRRTLHDVADSSSVLGKLRRELFHGERDVATLFVRSHLTSDPLTWAGSVRMTEPPVIWLQFQEQGGAGYVGFARQFGEERATQERKLAMLKAAVSVAESFETGLSTRVGCSDFAWEDFAALVVSHFPPPARTSVDLSGVPGVLWSPGA